MSPLFGLCLFISRVFTVTSSRLIRKYTFLQTVDPLSFQLMKVSPDSKNKTEEGFCTTTMKHLFIKFCLIRKKYILCEVVGSEGEISRQISSDRTSH